MITYDKIMYNQTNWRDDAVGKDKNVARGDFNPQPKTEQMYQYRISRATVFDFRHCTTNQIFKKWTDTGGEYPCPAHIPYSRYR